MENGTFEQIVSHLEKELELNGLEARDANKHCDATSFTTKLRGAQTNLPPLQKARSLSEPVPSAQTKKNQARINTNSADNNNNNFGQTNSNSNIKASNSTNANHSVNQNDKRPRPIYPPCKICDQTNHSTEKCYFGANAANRPPPRNRRPEEQNQVQQRNAQSNSDGNVQAAPQTLS